MTIKKIFHCALFLLGLTVASLPAQAAMVGTAQLQAGATLLESGGVDQQRDWITGQLVKGGVDADLATRRVAAMTDAQIQSLHQRIEDSPAGAGAEGLVIVFLVLVITELMGYTDIVPNWPAE